MADYSTFKVPDLKAMLGQRKLLQTGNKQALIARLQEDDEKKNSEETTTAKPDDKEDEITYSDDEAPASKSSVGKAAPPAAASKSEQAANSAGATVPVTGADQSGGETSAEAAESAAPATSFAMGLPSTAAEDEAKKRAERAKRFGLEDDGEAKQRADRAKRFGLDQTELSSGLDSALPERPLKRGRGRATGGDGNHHSGKRQSLDRRGRQGGGGRGNNHSNKNDKEHGRDTLSAADRAKAEKRAARFASS
ncbi:hypothetical protein E4U19_001991 [Claviceps sp. Clav32 group G5]|nr:hypothetical protein E4U19_001991 [Claviceps sp. Clav32 group G5]